jgi:pimeloyl-ACP methyl ester carboxylesterase
MNRLLVLALFVLSSTGLAGDQAKSTAPAVKYGSNAVVGRTFVHDGITLYYEIYGTGEPLLMIHGNGGSIADLTRQIAYFRARYKVIAMDSRDHGKSGDSTGALTYEKMTDDLAALLDHLKVGPVNVLGWSDGAIEALLLGMRHPTAVKKIVSMAANLTPNQDAIHPDVIAMVQTMTAAEPATVKDTPERRRELRVTGMMLVEPNIPMKALETITAPTLVLASDHDVIRDEHTIDIFHHIPNSQLAIFPNATHMIPFDDPATFNATVDRFLRTPFVKKNRVDDMMKSLEKMRRLPSPGTTPGSPAPPPA